MNADENEAETILIVDDNPANLAILFDHLHNAGFVISVAENGSDALKRAQRVQPSLILLDIMMPDMDGFETCRRLKEDAETKDIPVIFMTALADTADKVQGFAVGAVDYVTKPLQRDEVLARITTHITLHNLQKKLQEEVRVRRMTEEKLRRSNIELQARNEELNAFAYSVAHDLKDPLARIIGFAEVLADDPAAIPAEELQQYLAVIIHSGYKMSNIIEALLLLASVREEEVNLKPLDMTAIIAEARRRLEKMIKEYQPEIVLSDTFETTVLGHAPWVEEVWANYLSNALKYGGRPPYIELGTTLKDNQTVCFWMQDNGPGLTVAEQDRLFVPFTRLDQAQVEGYGLGLSIVRRIVEKLGGQVGVESKVGQGSKFYFTLQVAPGECREKLRA